MKREGMFGKIFKSEYERAQEMVQQETWFLEYGKRRRMHAMAIAALQAGAAGNVRAAADAAKQHMLDIFEQLLLDNEVCLGDPSNKKLDNHDEGREPIDMAVIHHSNHAEGISLSRLNALHLLRLYVPRYQDADRPIKDSDGRYQPIYSGHFDSSGNQVFYGYHWKVARDGEVTRLLPDSAIGWQAGNWDVNKRSVGIVFDDNLAHADPTPEALEAVADIIANEEYVRHDAVDASIVGHKEVFKATQCPGDRFEKGWKPELIARVKG